MAETDLRIQRLDDAAGMDRFIRAPFALYGDDPHWIPQLHLERRDHLNPKANPYFDHAEVAYWLALRGDRVVGRISAQVDQAYLERHGDRCGHFGFIEGEDDPEVFAGLFNAAEDWLRGRGMERVSGPFSLSINDEAGLLIHGFDSPPMMMMGHAPPYYARHLESLGYGKVQDLFAYIYERATAFPAGPAAVVKRAKRGGRITLRRLRKARYQDDLAVILDIFNDAWSDNWGFVPLTGAEIAHVAKNLKLLIREDLVTIAAVDGVPAAMAVSLPNLNEAIADLGGALLPFGWAKLLWRLKVGQMRTARLLLMGVRKEFHNTPLGTALAFTVIDAMYSDLQGAGFSQAELSWVLEDNLPMRHIIEACGATHYKTYRVYGKSLV